MKYSKLPAFLLFLGLAAAAVPSGAEQNYTNRKATPQSSGFNVHPLPPKPIINRTNPLPRKEQLEKLMSKAEIGSREYLVYLQEREEIALSEVHGAQRFLIDERADRTPKKKKEVEELLKSELKVLEGAIRQIDDFPFADKMNDIRKLVWDIKYGKISFGDCKGKTNLRILRKIQDEQVKSLKKFHKNRNEYVRKI